MSVACLALLVAACDGDSRRTPFDAARWLAGDGGARSEMVDDLVASRGLHGMALDEVVDLLGPPSSVHEDWTWSDPDAPETRLTVLFVDGELSRSVLKGPAVLVPAVQTPLQRANSDASSRWAAADFTAASEGDRARLLSELDSAVEAGELDAAALREVDFHRSAHSVSLLYELWTDEHDFLSIALDDALRVTGWNVAEPWDELSGGD